jgi:hypothetical protein
MAGRLLWLHGGGSSVIPAHPKVRKPRLHATKIQKKHRKKTIPRNFQERFLASVNTSVPDPSTVNSTIKKFRKPLISRDFLITGYL